MSFLVPKNIPLSLYIHIPWCIKKCPYCDFNSHAKKNNLPEQEYVEKLIQDLKYDLEFTANRRFDSIFFGGGTPSLFQPKYFGKILENINKIHPLNSNTEITMELNPGTIEHHNITDFKTAGINRVSIGAQSFQDEKLKSLGRIHNSNEILKTIDKIKKTNFNSFNIDLMYGLPNQNISDAIYDLNQAININPHHISWYNLTLEPNTLFYKNPPKLPSDDLIWQIQETGINLLQKNNLIQYEVSAYAQSNNQCRHNLNYWNFGDYIGIGAGAHSKITDFKNNNIYRYAKTRLPKNYLESKINTNFRKNFKNIEPKEIIFEFILNKARLLNNFNLNDFSHKTNLPLNYINDKINICLDKGFVSKNNSGDILLTNLGKKFLNNFIEVFL